MVRIGGIIGILIILLSACKTTAPPTGIFNSQDSLPVVDVFTYPSFKISTRLNNLYSSDSIYLTFLPNLDLQFTQRLYRSNAFKPIWKSDSLIHQATMLIKRSKDHGLNPDDYHLPIIDSLNNIEQIDSSHLIQHYTLLDIYLSDAMLKFCHHLYYGKLNAADYHESWNYPQKTNINIDSILLSKIMLNRVLTIDKYFEPKMQAYSELKKELKKFRCDSINRDEYNIKYPEILNRLGDSNIHISELKDCLAQKNLYPKNLINNKFDTLLFKAIIDLQKKHGLTPDGLPGRKTYDVLNWPHKRYREIIKLNLERLRWLPREIPLNYICTNIPGYQLDLFVSHELFYSTRIIVGKYDNQTPVITSNINYLVFNPCWTVPNSIASEKLLPRIKKDTTYLDKRNMFITLNGVRQDHNKIDFSQYNKNNFPFKIFQNTDPGNALGKVKFMFPNKHTIYLHDTPGKSLFNRDYRAFSHGCVRVQHAQHLAKLLVKDIDNNPKELDEFYQKGFPVKVYLKSPIPLYITYLTCYYNSELKMVQYYRDIYDFDDQLLKDLQQ